MSYPPPTVIINNGNTGPGCLIRGLWFIFVGLWLGAVVTGLAWFLIVSIIGLPLGLMLLNRLPQMMTLRPNPANAQMVVLSNGQVVVGYGRPQQAFIIRAIYFILIGWWLSGIWLATAWAIAGFSFGLGLPISFWMFNRVPAITTLG
ncbi:YccF domain-containing protein [Herpetosiphon gulosus]|uniref:YccF domain-containing protein n=1 Tax=Herpetosiphon gulosus TaxID=1973496 RepID=A0ABP9X076_9CHLR